MLNIYAGGARSLETMCLALSSKEGRATSSTPLLFLALANDRFRLNLYKLALLTQPAQWVLNYVALHRERMAHVAV